MEVTEQLSEVSSIFPVGYLGSKSGPQAWQQKSLPAKASWYSSSLPRGMF